MTGLLRETGTGLRAYRNYERGLRESKMPALITLVDFCDITIDSLVCRRS